MTQHDTKAGKTIMKLIFLVVAVSFVSAKSYSQSDQCRDNRQSSQCLKSVSNQCLSVFSGSVGTFLQKFSSAGFQQAMNFDFTRLSSITDNIQSGGKIIKLVMSIFQDFGQQAQSLLNSETNSPNDAAIGLANQTLSVIKRLVDDKEVRNDTNVKILFKSLLPALRGFHGGLKCIVNTIGGPQEWIMLAFLFLIARILDYMKDCFIISEQKNYCQFVEEPVIFGIGALQRILGIVSKIT